MNNPVSCPKCQSTQVSANKKGFSGKKAVAGVVLAGGVGLLAGTIGSNKIVITCLSCGVQFKPEAYPAPIPKISSESASEITSVFYYVFLVLFIIIAFFAFLSDSWIVGSLISLIIGFMVYGKITTHIISNRKSK